MLSRWIRTWYGKALNPFLWVLEKLGATAEALTLAGLLAHVAGGVAFALHALTWGLAAVLVGQLFDTFDGELARRQRIDSPFGGFLDSICDHLGDFAVYLGLLWYFLSLNSRAEVVLIAVAMFGSVFGSHVRSRAGMAGIDEKKIGMFTRFERTLVLVVGILINQLTIALWVLAIFNNSSALQRIAYAVRAARRKPGAAQG
jgi:CDP-diacylglycerol--glycerol-3-phosphate 3-phosphatidyltransferase